MFISTPPPTDKKVKTGRTISLQLFLSSVNKLELREMKSKRFWFPRRTLEKIIRCLYSCIGRCDIGHILHFLK